MSRSTSERKEASGSAADKNATDTRNALHGNADATWRTLIRWIFVAHNTKVSLASSCSASNNAPSKIDKNKLSKISY